MSDLEEIKSINLIEHIKQYFQESKQKTTKGVFFHTSPDDKTPNLLAYYNDGGFFDYVEGKGGSIIDFEVHYNNLTLGDAIKKIKETYNIEGEKLEQKKSPKWDDLCDNFEIYRMQKLTYEFERFLGTRGINREKRDLYIENINDLAKEFGMCDNLGIGVDGFKPVIIFPCLENNKIVGIKMRRIDGGLIRDKKSIALSGKKTGIIYKEINPAYVLIAEGETDYSILKVLGYKSVIGNLGGVASNSENIQKAVIGVDKIVCLYDNDKAGEKGARLLQEKIGRPIRIIKYPKIEGMDKYDINDLFKMGYGKDDFDKLFSESILLTEIQEKEEKNRDKNDSYNGIYVFDSLKKSFFDVENLDYVNINNICDFLHPLKRKDILDMRNSGEIPSYRGFCYYYGGKEGKYNLLNKDSILQVGKNPIVDPEIDFLIRNICNYNEENIEWLLKAILYKYTHINDVLIPAVIFHGVQGTGKGLLVKLLSTIFGEENTQIGLTQQHIEGQFSAYQGRKLIVEFKELNCGNTATGKKNMNKMKTFIMEDMIQVEKKRQDVFSTENIAWFIMSSNERNPVHLDGFDSGNRRLTIIKTGNTINGTKGREIQRSITNKEIVSNFLAFLFNKFPEVIISESISFLYNEDRQRLIEESESVGNLFFIWLFEKFPNVNKLTVSERDFLLSDYRKFIGDNDYNDERYKARYFNNGLSSKINIKTFRKGGIVQNGYIIDRDVEGDGFLPQGAIAQILEEIPI